MIRYNPGGIVPELEVHDLSTLTPEKHRLLQPAKAHFAQCFLATSCKAERHTGDKLWLVLQLTEGHLNNACQVDRASEEVHNEVSEAGNRRHR